MVPCRAFGTTQSRAAGMVLNISTACSGVAISPSPTMTRVGVLVLSFDNRHYSEHLSARRGDAK